MADLILTKVLGTFPSGASYNVQTYAQALVDRLTLSVPGTNVLFGQLGGTEPLTPLAGNGSTYGLWINNNVIYGWNVDAAKYLPLPPVAGQIVNGVLYKTEFICGAHTANTTLTTPDKSGTIATTEDLGAVLGTQTPSGTSITADWTLKKTVYLVLTGNSTVTNSGMADGQRQDFWFENNATAYTVTFSGVTWEGGTAPVITTASAGQRRISHVWLYQVGSTTFGEYKLNFQIGSGTDSTPPTVSTIIGTPPTTIKINFSELLQGGTLSTSDFIVKRAASTRTINSATASGSIVSLVMDIAFTTSQSYTVQYLGSSIKDLSGNLAASFGPSPVVMSGGGGGGNHNEPD